MTIDTNFIILALWTLGVIAINLYLTYVIDQIQLIRKTFYMQFIADILISSLAGFITYLLAKTVRMPEIYLVMEAAMIGHLSARVAYKTIILDNKLNEFKITDLESTLIEAQSPTMDYPTVFDIHSNQSH